MENAKVVGWVLEVCGSDPTTFFSCIVTGNGGSILYMNSFFSSAFSWFYVYVYTVLFLFDDCSCHLLN